MGFVLIFVLTWLAVFIIYGMYKKLSVLENTFVYLVVLTLGINIAWIVAEELKLISITKDGLLFTGYVLHRSVLIPFIYVILMNLVFRFQSVAGRLLCAGGALVLLLALDGVMLAYEVIRYLKWNLWLEAIEIVALQLATYLLLRLYRKAA
ncbi:hypothetical protein D3P08_00410 [Paenibacillus nanensis]|uniref:Uncharacterized protein n=1 Tax=Paenibacillus nanensis TaxID=393251 RepID=A0A3A1VRF8_9BACL|nr:hypothetical protein [Paenibacillus nanensis]RIX60090.1 hypothetical protein D3P08_00410 [Paenibacillus nanensis]